MARYFYDRHAVSSRQIYNWDAYQVSYVQGSGWTRFLYDTVDEDYLVSGWSDYTFSSSNGYSWAGTYYDPRPISTMPPGQPWYSANKSYIYRYTTAGAGGQWLRSVEIQYASVTKGAHVMHVADAGANYRTPNAVNSDGYWWERSAAITVYSKGAYIDTIVAEDGTYPEDGPVGNYWYVKGARAFPQLAVKTGGQVKQGIDGWVKVGGQLKRIVQMWTKVGGQLKES